MKRVQIPEFSGEKTRYENWKAAFTACVDNAPATPEYKLLQLRQYLTGEALRVIEDLGHSAAAYTAAKSRLDRKYVGKRRQLAMYLEVENAPPVRTGNAQDLEKFADLLDVTVINLKAAGKVELGAGSFYTKLQRKLPPKMLTEYHRWAHEKGKEQCLETLLAWAIQEAEFHTIATETVHGLEGRHASSGVREKKDSGRTYVGASTASSNAVSRSKSCGVCGDLHGPWACQVFKQMDATQRWAKAKKLGLCCRCLGHGHQGRSCQRTRTCGIDGCEDNHHRLLHTSSQQQTTSRQPVAA